MKALSLTLARTILVLLSTLVLAAHFLRAGHTIAAAAVLLAPALLSFRAAWAARAVQVVLLLGVVEWLRTLVRLVDVRRALGLPYTRLALILGAVAAVTAVAALLVRARPAPARSAA